MQIFLLGMMPHLWRCVRTPSISTSLRNVMSRSSNCAHYGTITGNYSNKDTYMMGLKPEELDCPRLRRILDLQSSAGVTSSAVKIKGIYLLVLCAACWCFQRSVVTFDTSACLISLLVFAAESIWAEPSPSGCRECFQYFI